MAAKLTHILNFEAKFHKELELFKKKTVYANNSGHFKIVSITKKNNLSLEDLII